MNGIEIRALRQRAGLAGHLICKKTGIARSRLSDIERGYVQPTSSEIVEIGRALDELVRAKQELTATAERIGWPASAL